MGLLSPKPLADSVAAGFGLLGFSALDWNCPPQTLGQSDCRHHRSQPHHKYQHRVQSVPNSLSFGLQSEQKCHAKHAHRVLINVRPAGSGMHNLARGRVCSYPRRLAKQGGLSGRGPMIAFGSGGAAWPSSIHLTQLKTRTLQTAAQKDEASQCSNLLSLFWMPQLR